MEPIFAQLSVEFWVAGKDLPWNKIAPNKPMQIKQGSNMYVTKDGMAVMMQANLANAHSRFDLSLRDSGGKQRYFNLKG